MYDAPSEAAAAYIRAALELFGDAAMLNDVPSSIQIPVMRTQVEVKQHRYPLDESGYKGATQHKALGKWMASIVVRGTSHYRGLYRTTEYFRDETILNDLTAT